MPRGACATGLFYARHYSVAGVLLGAMRLHTVGFILVLASTLLHVFAATIIQLQASTCVTFKWHLSPFPIIV